MFVRIWCNWNSHAFLEPGWYQCMVAFFLSICRSSELKSFVGFNFFYLIQLALYHNHPLWQSDKLWHHCMPWITFIPFTTGKKQSTALKPKDTTKPTAKSHPKGLPRGPSYLHHQLGFRVHHIGREKPHSNLNSKCLIQTIINYNRGEIE